jgi:hypothetical protein
LVIGSYGHGNLPAQRASPIGHNTLGRSWFLGNRWPLLTLANQTAEKSAHRPHYVGHLTHLKTRTAGWQEAKTIPKNQNDSRKRLRFTTEEIMRTIDAVKAAGLTIYGVEITLAGAINISTQPPSSGISKSKKPATPRQESNAVDGTIPVEKQA